MRSRSSHCAALSSSCKVRCVGCANLSRGGERQSPCRRARFLVALLIILEEFARLLEPYALTPAQFQTLAILHGAGRPLPHNVIARRLLVSRGTVTWLVDALEKRGLVQRERQPSSRRTVLVAVTEAGSAIVTEATPIMVQCNLDVTADLSIEEQDLLVDLLAWMHHRLIRRRTEQ
jgi:MarR family 2-MHQ and catechol resistance regulon transcriptional repressor